MQKKQKNTGLVWFNKNLRSQDNEALFRACKNHDNVISVYFLDPRGFEVTNYGFKKTAVFRAQFLLETLKDLKEQLKKLNITLLIFNKTPESYITFLCEKYNIDTIYAQKEWTDEEDKIICKVKNTIPKEVTFNEYYDQFLFHPDDIKMSISDIPKIFTQFRKYLEKYIPIREVNHTIPKETSNLLKEKTQIPSLTALGYDSFKINQNSAFPFLGGENEAFKRIDHYFFNTKKLARYKKTRNGLVGTDYSSKLSSWLANGSISAKQIYSKVKEFEKIHLKNDSTYWLVFELIWRDFFKYISLKHHNYIFKIEGILNKNYDWKNDDKTIQQWIHGETKEPFVNANMIELKKTGWMSNRGRQNVASYFAKELHIDWRIGAAYFESTLIDYDVHSNYGNWMYAAGVGNDPRDRKFNIQLQSEKYDANKEFRNLWLKK